MAPKNDTIRGMMRPTLQPSLESPPRRLALKLSVVLFSTAIALVGAELVLRARNPFGFRMRGNTLVLTANKVYDIRADAKSRSDQIDAHVVHTKNSLGFRGPEPPRDFADWLTMVAVGGSTTECFYLSDGRTWPERVAARLQPEMRKVWLDNAGLDGHSTFGHLLLTRQALVPLHPKVTLYLIGVNDMFADEPRGFDKVAQNQWATLADHSELAATLLGDVDPRTGIDTRPMEVDLWEKLDGALAWRLLERYNDVTRQVGRERGVLTIDLARAMPKDSTFFYDFFHFTNEGADRVGAIVHDALAPWLAARYPDRVTSRSR